VQKSNLGSQGTYGDEQNPILKSQGTAVDGRTNAWKVKEQLLMNKI